MNSSNTVTPVTATKGRWRLRFGLRTLLVIVTVAAIGLGYLGMLLQRVRHQRHVVAQIEAAGGEVVYHWEQVGFGPPYEYSAEYEVISEGETWDGRKTRIRRNMERELISEVVTAPPGPWILRTLFGDDLFAYVETVSFAWDDGQSPQELDPELLLEFPELKHVALRGPQVSDEWIRCLAQVPELRSVGLRGDEESTATAKGLTQLTAAKELRELGLDGTWVRDEIVTGIADLSQLYSLSINEGPNLTSAFFTNLGGLTELRELYIRKAPQIDDQRTESLRRLTKLQKLTFLVTATSDATLVHLPGLIHLESLDLDLTKVGDPGMECLAALPNLKRLELTGTKVGDAGLESLSRLRQLHYLELGGTLVTDCGMPTLGRMTQLKTLDLDGTQVTDCGVMQLGTLHNLQELSVDDSSVTQDGGRALESILPRKCRVDW